MLRELSYKDLEIEKEINNLIGKEFNLLEKCYSLLPTHYLECEDDIINLSKYEYIEQTISTSDKRFGLFVNIDFEKINFELLFETKEFWKTYKNVIRF